MCLYEGVSRVLCQRDGEIGEGEGEGMVDKKEGIQSYEGMGGESQALWIRQELTDERVCWSLQKEWKKRNGSENGAEQESISQDGDLYGDDAALPKSVSVSDLVIHHCSSWWPDSDPSQIVDEKAFNLPSQQNSISSLLLNPPSSSDSSSSSNPDSDPERLPSSKQRNSEDELDEEENDEYLSKEDRQAKMGSLLERIGDKHEDEEEEGEGEGEMGEMVEMGEKSEEAEEILEESVTTTIQGVVEMAEDEEDEEGSEQRQELEEQARQTLANPDLLQ